jgi:UDP-glucose 4-epimerase
VAYGKAYNLGGAQEISILDLAELIIRTTGSTSEVELVAYENAYGSGYEDMRRRVPDNTLSHELVGFVPRIRIEAMVREVAQSLSTAVDGDDWIMSQAHPAHVPAGAVS